MSEEKHSGPKPCCGGDEESISKLKFTPVPTSCCGGDATPKVVEDSPKPACCGGETAPKPNEAPKMPSCCGGGDHDHNREAGDEGDSSCCHPRRSVDWLLWGSAAIIIPAYLIHWLAPALVESFAWLKTFTGGVFELINKMWWGLLIGITVVGILAKVPRELVVGALGRSGTFGGLLRATAAGTLLDLCSHGILLVGMQLYRRGASLGQTMAFLIASPWNSLSLTLILIALIGLKWTLAFLLLSIVIALIAGLVFEGLVKRGVLPPNPNRTDLPENFRLGPEIRKRFREAHFHRGLFLEMAKTGLSESKMILRWIFFGTVMAALVRASLSADTFSAWFGPSIGGLLLTLFATTIIEVCSEGSSPIAADLITRGGAPGNAFTFLMAGVATDYTEILSLRETTKSWKIALFLPLVTVPQVLLIGWILNHFGAGH
ncbi:MAG: permease [Verrucomicrobiae bacterium]|nr:permease [Verrucomicrobiae bacterium]